MRQLRSLPWRIIRRCHRIAINGRWKYLGYDYISPIDGVTLKIPSDSRLGHLLRYGDFEAAEQIFVKRFLKKGDTFVDVGANIGLYSILAGALVGVKGQVCAFEPCSLTFRRLIRNVQRNAMPHVSCHQIALSDHTGQATLTTSQSGFDAWNSLAGSLIEGESAAEVVPTECWDDFVARNPKFARPTMMKIDVEGWELPVLHGAQKALMASDAPVLQLEFTSDNATAAGSSCAELFDRLSGYGYRLYRFDLERPELDEVFCAPEFGHCNLYAIKCLTNVIERIQSSQG